MSRVEKGSLFAITLKLMGKSSTDPSKYFEHYAYYFAVKRRYITVKSWAIELDTSKVAHLHGIVKSKFNCTFASFIKDLRLPYFHVVVKVCSDVPGWTRYMMKSPVKTYLEFPFSNSDAIDGASLLSSHTREIINNLLEK